ncbi:Hypothetical_protein [Hexamita inflata]|uniref:Hypothetical_protein n=1 Tax=Hexamita inflata TaxID=28002 RepID=A0ABP1KCM5_9EUKA
MLIFKRDVDRKQYQSDFFNSILIQFSLLYRNCKFTRMIICFRYTYIRQVQLRSQGNQRLKYKHPASCKPIYTGIHLRTMRAFLKKRWHDLQLAVEVLWFSFVHWWYVVKIEAKLYTLLLIFKCNCFFQLLL